MTKESLLEALPEVLAEDERMQALAASIADVLAGRTDEIRQVLIYPQIGSLPDALLDILAYDFNVAWWDASYTLEEKRETLRQSWYVHKHMGTPGAVKAALAAIYPGVVLEEWWQYGGQPYHWRLTIPIDPTAVDPVKHAIVLGLVSTYTNLRSVLDETRYYDAGGVAIWYAATAVIGQEITDSAVAARY